MKNQALIQINQKNKINYGKYKYQNENNYNIKNLKNISKNLEKNRFLKSYKSADVTDFFHKSKNRLHIRKTWKIKFYKI